MKKYLNDAANGTEGNFTDRCVLQLKQAEAGEAPAFDRLVGAIARGWCHPSNAHKEMDTDLVSAIASEIRADSQLSANAPWLTIAHTLCTDAGVPSGHIADRLEGLRAALQAKQKQSINVTRIGFGTYEVRMNCVTDTAINGLGGGFPARLQAGDSFVCTLGADFTVDGKPMPIRDVLVAWANYMGKQLVFTGEHETGEFTP